MKNFIAIWLLPVLLLSTSVAQNGIIRQVMGSAGNYSENQTVALSSTVGEAFVIKQENQSISMSQGFQQGGLAIALKTDPLMPNLIKMKIFPNPASRVIQLQSGMKRVSQVEIYSLDGKKVIELDYHGGPIDIQSLERGYYFLKAFDVERNLVGSTKFVKK
ncbi:MAG: T9SS type A sorting domain-containing protein [Bacteroidia bacterium]|nr:T9SS type A sorting domain-containing protein [Bacteroidia bacterium]